MTTKQVILKQNLGTGFKSDAGRKKIDVDLSQFVDGTTTHMIGGKLVAGEEPIQVKDIFRLLANNEDNTRRLRRPGIHPILMDMPRLYNGSFVAGSTGFPRIKGNKPTLETQNYHSGERFKSFYNDTPHSELWDTGTRGNNKIWNAPLASGYVVCGEAIEVYLTVSVSYDNVGAEPEKENDAVTFRKVLRNFNSDGDIDGISSRPYADRGILFSNGSILPSGKEFIESLTADAMEGYGKWEQWEVINEIPASVTNGASGTYTASNGVKKVGNDFRLNVHPSVYNSLSVSPSGKVSSQSSTVKIRVRSNLLLSKQTTLKASDNYRGLIHFASTPIFIPNLLDVSFSDTGPAFNIRDSISGLKVKYTITKGSNFITGARLMQNGIAKNSDSSIDYNQFNKELITPNMNDYISDFNFSNNIVSFTVPTLFAFNTMPVIIVFDVDASSAPSGQASEVNITAEVDTTAISIPGSLMTSSANGFSVTLRRP